MPSPQWPLLAEVVGDIVLPFLVVELVNRYAFPFRQHFDCLAESLRHLSQHHRGWNRFPQLVSHERRQSESGCEFADIAVQVEAVEALRLQLNVPVRSSGMVAIPEFYAKAGHAARRFEVEELARVLVQRILPGMSLVYATSRSSSQCASMVAVRWSKAARSADVIAGANFGMVSASLGRSRRAYVLENNKTMRNPSGVS
jgi:hypothetical protein